MGGGGAVGIALGGTATVCCVHDRVKRQVKTEEHVRRLGLEAGIIYDERQHKIHRCGCCENLFVDASDEPLYCKVCNRLPVHKIVGPLPAPMGPVDG